MDVRVIAGDPAAHETPLLAVIHFKDDGDLAGPAAAADELTGGSLSRSLAAGDFKGGTADSAVAWTTGEDGPARVVLLGAGSADDFDAEQLRRVTGRAVRQGEKLKVDRVTLWLGELDVDDERLGQSVAEAAVLAGWEFRELKTGATEDDDGAKASVKTLEVSAASDGDGFAEGVRLGVAFGNGENFARTLQARPGNVATPTHLADEAMAMAREWGLDITVLGPDELEAERCHALLSVALGSDQEPRMIVLRYDGGDEGEAPLALVGKGLTFDAGGISLKPPKGMEEMKFDMSGGAAVLGAMRALAEAKLPVNVVGVVPSSENLLGGSAMKPGDVIGSRAGKTIEVINTDAEGRLILADALSYASDLEPVAMVDCATLTGACVIALGHHASAVLGNDDRVVDELLQAGRDSGERCWQLPLWKEYRKQLDSDTADLMNVGGRPAGTVTAACFLQEFVKEGVKWGHLDIAGTAYGEGSQPYQRKGGVGVPTRLLLEWVRSRSR